MIGDRSGDPRATNSRAPQGVGRGSGAAGSQVNATFANDCHQDADCPASDAPGKRGAPRGGAAGAANLLTGHNGTSGCSCYKAVAATNNRNSFGPGVCGVPDCAKYRVAVVGAFDYPGTVIEAWAALGVDGGWIWLTETPWGRDAAIFGRVWPRGVAVFECAYGARRAFRQVTRYGWAGNGFAIVDY